MPADLSSPISLDADWAAAVRRLADSIELRDGQPPLSDRALTHLTSTGVAHLVSTSADGIVVGYGQRDGANSEVAGTATGSAAVLDGWGAEVQTVWSHGTRSYLPPLLTERGFRPTRVLHQLRRDAGDPVPPLKPPDGITIDTFRPGVDEQAWLQVNAAAFASHPEQSRVTLTDLQALESEAWFDADGFFLAHRGDELLGYHWTKIHADGVGEVYVIGVGPGAQGLGLGKLLLDAGLRYLAEVGCPEVLLYVDESNSGAMRLYESVGFHRYDADTQWSRAAG